MSLTATHSQLTSVATDDDDDDDNINMTLPTFQASVERIYPFVKQDGVKKGIIDNINFQYSVNAQNRLVTNDEDFFTSRMFDNARVGASHSIPVATNFKVAKFFSVSLGGNYEDVWTLETYNRSYDDVAEEVVYRYG